MNVISCGSESPSGPPENITSENKHSRKIPKNRFYIVTKSYQQTKIAGLKLINKKELFHGTFDRVMMPPALTIRGFREYPVKPEFLISTRLGRKLNDIEFIGNYLFISDRARSVLLETSGADFAFLPVDSIFENEAETNKHWLCDVISVLDAVDESQSIVRKTLGSSGERVHEILPGTKLKFNDAVVNSHRAFRLKTNFNVIICDEKLKYSIASAGLTGFRYKDASKI